MNRHGLPFVCSLGELLMSQISLSMNMDSNISVHNGLFFADFYSCDMSTQYICHVLGNQEAVDWNGGCSRGRLEGEAGSHTALWLEIGVRERRRAQRKGTRD